jgi:hypothetical protein
VALERGLFRRRVLVVAIQVALGEIAVRVDRRRPHGGISLIERRSVDPRNRFHAAAIHLAAQELMKVEPEAVLKNEHILARLGVNAEDARECERKKSSLHRHYSTFPFEYAPSLMCDP